MYIQYIYIIMMFSFLRSCLPSTEDSDQKQKELEQARPAMVRRSSTHVQRLQVHVLKHMIDEVEQNTHIDRQTDRDREREKDTHTHKHNMEIHGVHEVGIAASTWSIGQ